MMKKIMKKLGYAPHEELDAAQRRADANDARADCLSEELEKERSLNTEIILKAIRESRVFSEEEGMIRSGPLIDMEIEREYDSYSRSVRPPVTPEWYHWSIKLDIALLRRVHQDLERTGGSLEMEHLLGVVVEKMKRELRVAIRYMSFTTR